MRDVTVTNRIRLWHPRWRLCAVCARPARGFGWADPWPSRAPRPPRWFCSRACQRFWSERLREFGMVDLTEQEHAAIGVTMRRLGALMEEIGWDTRFADLSEAEVRALIAEAVEGFREAMAATAAEMPEVPF